jgi:hypothetical protein
MARFSGRAGRRPIGEEVERMSDESMGDEVYQPGTGVDGDDAEMIDPEDDLNSREIDYMEEGYSPPERPLGADHYGVTAAERRQGESLDQRLSEEVPDIAPPTGDGIGDVEDYDGEPVDREAGNVRAGRLVAPEQGVEVQPEDVDDTVAYDVGIDGGAASAEEAAMHIVDDHDTDRM